MKSHSTVRTGLLAASHAAVLAPLLLGVPHTHSALFGGLDGSLPNGNLDARSTSATGARRQVTVAGRK